MKVFISWSGAQSKAIADVVQAWLPNVMQHVKPFVSFEIDKGESWNEVLTRELEETNFGILCLTKNNLTSPWLHYEAGALSKSVAARVCPLLYDVKKSEVGLPFKSLQITEFDEADMLRMLQSLNRSSGSLLSDRQLSESLGIWWPKLREQLALVDAADDAAAGVEPGLPMPSENEILHQLLREVRGLGERLGAIESPSGTRSLAAHGGDRSALVAGELIHDMLLSSGVRLDKMRVGKDEVTFTCGILDLKILNGLEAGIQMIASKWKTAVEIRDKNGAPVMSFPPF